MRRANPYPQMNALPITAKTYRIVNSIGEPPRLGNMQSQATGSISRKPNATTGVSSHLAYPDTNTNAATPTRLTIVNHPPSVGLPKKPLSIASSTFATQLPSPGIVMQ